MERVIRFNHRNPHPLLQLQRLLLLQGKSLAMKAIKPDVSQKAANLFYFQLFKQLYIITTYVVAENPVP